ncbi:hypothetical protein BDP55DRAFT_694225 [Colletotrichum godetiae]|uniref:BZIP transcription factor n=1 Tax=Colletotrichum godetiae TaxID=1209918 RepID=A0AAJ0ESP5_9PEZI|nr:uncharacterized protein BDP55DRAFT_694225 [Colletotrichum godetiae]KAK1675291.1 hypothetical protein BDP55DRAFT_694225 [Colletotrichum godetiae]
MTSTPTPSCTQDTAARSPGRTSHTAATSQRLKKREYDRKAQRVAREKTKNRIAQLESLVEKLSHQDDTATTASLMAELSKVTEQRNKLMRCLKTTSSLFNDHVKEAESWGSTGMVCDIPSPPKPPLIEEVSPKHPSPGSSTSPAYSSAPVFDGSTDDVLEREIGDDMDSFMDESSLDISQLLGDSMFQPDFTAPVPLEDTHERQMTAVTLDTPTPRKKQQLTTKHRQHASKCHCSSTTRVRRLSDGSQGETIEDVPVHAVLHGWDSIAHSGRMTPLWRKVRQLDELCFSACGQAERLAVLFIIHLLMRAYADPTLVKSAVVPMWYLKSPLQEISHDPSADYFAWPALRYRFAVAPHRYCSNLFWHMFKEHLRIVWPYDFRDCYTRNMQLGTYGLSPLFKEKIHDLRSWTMAPDFFAQFPELMQDIPKFPGQPSRPARNDGEDESQSPRTDNDMKNRVLFPTSSHVSGLFLSELGIDSVTDCFDF